ncbi:MAG: PLP-dependent aminotransferase family protein [Chloroflexi bacterium]|nr:PLP-dependent aminotransferase family protein [Chloroflexota bacterium]
MSLAIQLERTGHVALYQQIVEQVKDRISSHRLPPGARLPTIRQFAQELGVTRVTIQNAYNELQTGGWIEATTGRGTFVSQTMQPNAAMRLSSQQLTPDAVIGDILQINEIVGVRSMASASPDPALFPVDEFWNTLNELRHQASALVSYSSSQGDPFLRIEVANQLEERGIRVLPDDILITSGVTQSLSLITQTLCRPGDSVLVEQPTYLGALHVLKAHGVQVIGAPLDAEGPELDVLERLAIQHRPRFFYTIPSFQNPTGLCMSLARRQALLALAERHNFLLVEDDIYAPLAYDQPAPPALKALDRTGMVIHTSSFSKTFMPGLRLGYVVAPPPLHQNLLTMRRATDLCSPPLSQRMMANFLATRGLQKHLRRVLPIYRERRDALLAALQHRMPHTVTWTKPVGGFCCWLTLPRHHALSNLHQLTLQQGWAFAPGDVFLVQPSTNYHLRVCFGNQGVETIRSGIEVLGNLIRECLQRADLRNPQPSDWTPLV